MSVCRSCGAPIRWVKTDQGRRMPLDPNPVADGNVVLTAATDLEYGNPVARVLSPVEAAERVGDRYRSHFVSCPNAAAHRRGR